MYMRLGLSQSKGYAECWAASNDQVTWQYIAWTGMIAGLIVIRYEDTI